MLTKKAAELRESDVTPKELFLKRRDFIAAAGVTAAAVATNGLGVFGEAAVVEAQNPAAQKLANLKKSPFSTDEKLNSYRDVTTYNNFYEFGTRQGRSREVRPHAQAQALVGGGRRAVRQTRHLQH